MTASETMVNVVGRSHTEDVFRLGSPPGSPDRPGLMRGLCAKIQSAPNLGEPSYHLLIYAERNGVALKRFRKFIDAIAEQGVSIGIHTEDNVENDCFELPEAKYILVLWSPLLFRAAKEELLRIAELAKESGTQMLNDVQSLMDIADRRCVLRKLKENDIAVPEYVECIYDEANPPRVEEYEEHIVVNGQQINKPFLEKPVDRQDRDIYLYLPHAIGGGRAFVSSIESGDDQSICRWEESGGIRHEGAFIYQEYPKSDGFRINVSCLGTLTYAYAVTSPAVRTSSHTSDGHGAGSPIAAGGPEIAPNLLDHGHRVYMNQEEKQVVNRLRGLFQQTIIGVTFMRVKGANRKIRSHVMDLWVSVPRWGLLEHFEDVVGELLKEIGCAPKAFVGHHLSAVLESPAAGVRRRSVCLGSELLCVVVLARHGERTPKQKIKAKFTLSNAFHAGWFCGFLQQENCVPVSEKAFDLRKANQLKRLSNALKVLQEGGHKLQQLEEALTCIKRANMDYHAKIVMSGGSELQITLKWGGELTFDGKKGSEECGLQFRSQTFPDENVGELHACLEHDIEISSSKEQRCMQTAAAFARGLLSLIGPLPPIITELVRTVDDTQWGGPSGVKDERDDSWVTKSWHEVEALAGECVHPELRQQYATPKEGILALAQHVRDLEQLLVHHTGGAFYMGETASLVRERYKDVASSLVDGKSDVLVVVPHAFDHLYYDFTHNKELIGGCGEQAVNLLETSFSLSDRLSKVASVVETASSDVVPGKPGGFKVWFLWTLRHHLRRAAGKKDDNEEQDDPKNTAKLDMPSEVGPCRSRLYFGHNSWLQGFMTLLFSSSMSEYRPAAISIEFARHIRLGFLCRLVVRLQRQLLGEGELRVVFKYADTEQGPLMDVFDLSFEEVDLWWTKVLEALSVNT
mmetsp:Transcript_45541/g.105579  ORF Transcript_45541/g.105579 Transcript_45541/m.105579 type:complete len:914 (-) Transcript_45541:51-2792(-)